MSSGKLLREKERGVSAQRPRESDSLESRRDYTNSCTESCIRLLGHTLIQFRQQQALVPFRSVRLRRIRVEDLLRRREYSDGKEFE